jgi:hypothetical protein
MALPPRSAAVLVQLYNAPSATPKELGVISDFQTTGGAKPRQEDFYSYQWWFKDYPDEVIVKINKGASVGGGGGVIVAFTYVTALAYESVYPNNIVTSYTPGAPLFEPVPNPNGDTGTTTSTYTIAGDFRFPRWHSETAYDFSASPASWPGIVPPTSSTAQVIGGTVDLSLFGGWSVDVSATNYQSEVFNTTTSAYEYYPFDQATSTYKQTCKFTVNILNTDVCCWNKGTIIRGKATFKSVLAPTTPLDSSGGTTGFGYGGIEIAYGATYAAAGDAVWEVTIEDGFEPTEIEIPKVSGSITFINDFYVTEVVPPP